MKPYSQRNCALSQGPIRRRGHMTGPEAASTTAGDACQQARCCHTLASGSWNSKHVLSLARDSDPSLRRRQKRGRKSGKEVGEVGLHMVSGSFPYLGLRASPDKRLLGKGSQELPWEGAVEMGAALAPGKWGWLMLQETAAAGSLLSLSHDSPRWG